MSDQIITLWEHLRLEHTLAVSGSEDDQKRADWARIAQFEDAIRAATASSFEGLKRQLWLALLHSMPDVVEPARHYDMDIAALESREEDFDFNARLIVSALRSLAAITSAGGRV